MPDYCVEYRGTAAETIREDVMIGKASLAAALYQVIHDLQNDAALDGTIGLEITEVDASD